jgi:hypothetical protein
LRKGTIELPHALVQDDLLLGIWRPVDSVAQNRMRFGFIAAKPLPFGPVKSMEKHDSR